MIRVLSSHIIQYVAEMPNTTLKCPFQPVRRWKCGPPAASASQLHPEPSGLPRGRPAAGSAAGRPPLLQPHPLQGQEEMEGRRGSGQLCKRIDNCTRKHSFVNQITLTAHFRGDKLFAAFSAAVEQAAARRTRRTTSWRSTSGGRRATPAGSHTDTPNTSGMPGEKY